MTRSDTGADGTFVLTSGRTGSTMLARLLHAHPHIAVVSDVLEPAATDPYYDRRMVVDGPAFWRLLSRPALAQRVIQWRERRTEELLYLPERDEDVSLLMAYTLPILEPDDPWGLREELERVVAGRPAAPAPDHFLFVCRWLRDRVGARRWVERTGGSLPHAADIIGAWPDAKFIVLMCDPAEVALSMRTGSFFRLCLAAEHDDVEHWLDAHYADPARLAAMLDRWTEQAERALSSVPAHRVHRMTYEGFTADPVDELERVVGFVLDRAPSPSDHDWARGAAAQVGRAAGHLDRLPPDDAQSVIDACRSSRARWREAFVRPDSRPR